MGRKIWLIIGAIATIALGVLIWRLDIPNWKKLDVELIYAQPRASIVYDASGEAMSTLSGSGNRSWTSLTAVPEHVRNAFLAAEDQRFYEHSGISVRRILAATLQNLKSRGYTQGASTITQQLIKLTHLSSTKTLSRKAQEAVLALQLERTLTKDQILECYLNTVYFGAGAYGIGAASQVYFNKEPSELTIAEGALLAGIIKAPSNYAPHIDPERAISRRDLILGEMYECGYISDVQADVAKAEALNLVMQTNTGRQYGWFLDATLDEASNLLGQSVDNILSAGYLIYTGFDPAMQDAMDTLFADDSNFPTGAADGTPVQAAMVAIAPTSGEISALVGGRRYEVQRGLNRAIQIQRSPGSAIKPVSVYAAAIDAYNFTPSSMIEDTPRTFDNDYTPGNAGGNSYGTVTLREALSRSLNIATVDLADLIGINAVRNYALRFGLDLSAQDANLSLALGSMTYGISPAELCASYATLANGGTQVQPHLIRSIVDLDGRVIYEAKEFPQRAVQTSTAYMLTDMLKTAASTGSAKALSSTNIPVAAKTGTVSDADGSTRDIWTAAYTPDLAVTVWMGYDTPNTEHAMASSIGGSGYPAQLCAAFLTAVSDNLSHADFVQPNTVKTALLDALALEADQVLLATEQTPAKYTVQELFHLDDMPQDFSTEWTAPEAIVDLTLLSRNGETPVLQFTVQSSNAEYLILRTVNGETSVIATLSGAPGDTLRYADTTADLNQSATYKVLPRNKLLYAQGELLTGNESASVTYSPGGLLNLLFGTNPNRPTPEPATIEINKEPSLFG